MNLKASKRRNVAPAIGCGPKQNRAFSLPRFPRARGFAISRYQASKQQEIIKATRFFSLPITTKETVKLY